MTSKMAAGVGAKRQFRSLFPNSSSLGTVCVWAWRMLGGMRVPMCVCRVCSACDGCLSGCVFTYAYTSLPVLADAVIFDSLRLSPRSFRRVVTRSTRCRVWVSLATSTPHLRGEQWWGGAEPERTGAVLGTTGIAVVPRTETSGPKRTFW